MKKVSKQPRRMEVTKDKPEITVGLDMGDRYSHYCLLNQQGDVVEEGRMQSTESALRRHFEGEPCLRIALECGTHSPWVSLLLTALATRSSWPTPARSAERRFFVRPGNLALFPQPVQPL